MPVHIQSRAVKSEHFYCTDVNLRFIRIGVTFKGMRLNEML